MGIGFIVIIVFLATLLGLFARQALSVTDEPSDANESQDEPHDQHPHAM
ncbi:hypothetical protein JI721_02635 [Alicyclobacillus cycloheptanicus]|uniref:Tumour necrosis factor receptor superfamily member 19 n=1 Tax=Alicyclobacillus cycloheptanicus TaxID=1457 RepID=A0ABT9XKS0_9BACL|nr:hypothetical protein [Alicyclobacillus cycloheptanicus]MDQ0190875.1 hypothetical protein [Alicyclobacillus cycloheptanicus]WDM01764.1 hypothetical protein JI721_02635 [Alicyclobacillus cycloheptanicus]